jgi:ABC-type spermidine/putrescine transport system permease subunit II
MGAMVTETRLQIRATAFLGAYQLQLFLFAALPCIPNNIVSSFPNSIVSNFSNSIVSSFIPK